MATITTILASDIIASSRVTLNTNFANLNTDKVDINSTYADPAWITSLSGSKITGNIGGNAATATALATARTIAGISFDGTANIAIPSTGLSDSSDIVRGASSVASGQVLYGTGAGVAGSEANLFWDAANDRLGVGTNTPAVPLHVARGDVSQFLVSGTTRALRVTTNSTEAVLAGVDQTGFSSFQPIMIQATRLAFNNGAAEIARFAVTTGNLLLGTTTDGNFRLDIGSSGSAGTLRVYDQTPTTGVTQVIVRAGAGQSTTNLQTWQNSGGTAVASVASNGTLIATGIVTSSAVFNSTNDLALDAAAGFSVLLRPNGGSERVRVGDTFIRTRNSQVFQFSSDATSFGTPDISLSRASANTLQVGDGGSNANGGLFASSIGVGVTPSIAANVNQVIIRGGSAQSTTNLQTWQNSGGTTLALVGPTGRFVSDVGYDSRTDAFSYQVNAALNSGGQVSWGPNAGNYYNPDVAIRRNGIGVIEVTNGTAGTFRDLYLRGVRPVGSTVANLPTASGNVGMLATVTDATVTTIGTTVAGGGGNTVLVWSNGTNWRIYAN